MTIGDIVAKIYKDTKTNASSYVASDMLIEINAAYDRVASLLLRADARWQWDDNNNTDFPIATAALVSGQQDYTLSASFLTIDRVEVQDATGNWTELDQIDQQLLKRDRKTALEAYRMTPGTPVEYDVSSKSVLLYPIPSYSLAAALKVYFTRGPAYFSSADVSAGTKEPGFNQLFHVLIPLWVTYNYVLMNIPALATGVMNEIQMKEQAIADFYGLRDRDVRPRLSVSTDSNK